MTTEITNGCGATFHVGQTVTHYDGWTGVVIGIRETPSADMLLVEPHQPEQLSSRDYYALNAYHAEQTGKTHFCRPRDHGLGMGCFLEADPHY